MAYRLGELSVEVGAQAGPLVDGRELYRFFHTGDDETFALRGVSISVGAGELVAVAGPSGSGKSTLLACLAGLDEPDGGHVMIAGRRITRRDEATRAGLRARWIGMLLQSGNLIEHLSVAQNIQAAQALVPHAPGRRPHFRARRGQDGGTRPGPARLLGDVGLAGRASARPSTLSGGEAARAALAVAMANDPPVLLADEPTGEVDRQAEDRVLELLRGRADRGKAVLVVTHSDSVAAATDRVVRMVDGRVIDG
jgi:putative ABC transport system ATP-binding protein